MLLVIINNCSSPKEYNNNLLEGEVPDTWTKPLPKTEDYTGMWWISFSDKKMKWLFSSEISNEYKK